MSTIPRPTGLQQILTSRWPTTTESDAARIASGQQEHDEPGVVGVSSSSVITRTVAMPEIQAAISNPRANLRAMPCLLDHDETDGGRSPMPCFIFRRRLFHHRGPRTTGIPVRIFSSVLRLSPRTGGPDLVALGRLQGRGYQWTFASLITRS